MKIFKNHLSLVALISIAGTAYAQDSYDAQTMANSDLMGTSRFVAMGGALGALGGDISVMSTNPAGTAMYRKSDAAITLSGLFTGKGAMDHDGARMSLDQGGALIAFDMENPTTKGIQFVNFGINYRKKRNFLFNQVTDVQHLDGVFSQTYQIADMGNWAMYDARRQGQEYDSYFGSLLQMATMEDNTVLVDMQDADGNPVMDEYGNIQYDGIGAESACYERATYGANNQADLNISFNIGDQFFVGGSIGIYDIDYNRESFYRETDAARNTYDITSWYQTTGDGFDVKLGFICRPIEDSPFRFGVSVHTPIWYRLTDSNGASLYYNNDFFCNLSTGEYKYRYRTPWKFGVSLGHTVGKNFAIGVEYEVQDMSTAKYAEVDGYGSEVFRNINRITEKTLRGQHTLKVGLEYKPVEALSLRCGYNYVSSPFKKDAYRTIGYDSYYTETDWTNWGDIHRFTVGLGYRYRGGYFDLAWQYQAQKGDFYAFDNGAEFKPTKIDANRSQLMATLGFRF